MSGIAGIIHFDGRPMQAGSIEGMTRAMSGRGPDGLGHWHDAMAALGHCQLRSLAEHAHEVQPCVDAASGRVAVIDGRLDNLADLARALRYSGEQLRNLTAGRVLLDAYERWGDAVPERLEGDFAFGVWDPGARSLFCARDRVGNRPFHYVFTGSTFAFASDASALLGLPCCPANLDLDFVAEVLASRWTSLDATFWAGLQRLPPAHCLQVEAGRCRRAVYWRPDAEATLPCRSPEDYAEYYRALLYDVLRQSARSHAPVACEVSGGLDSSALFAVAADLQRQGEWDAPELHGYTLDFRGAGDADEMRYAEAVARHCGKPITAIPPSRMPIAWHLDWSATHGWPAGYANGVLTRGLRETARDRSARCIVVGVGGDEWLDGYPAYFADAIGAGHWRDLGRMLVEDSRDAGLSRSLYWLARYGIGPLLPEGARRTLHALQHWSSRRDAWLAPAMRQRLHRHLAVQAGEQIPVARVGQRSLLLQLAGAFGMLARESEERACAYAGLDIRRPFWDRRLIEFAVATPERLRCRGNTTKVTHRRAMRGLLPEEVRERGSKADFSIAFNQRGPEIRDFLEPALPQIADWVLAPRARRVLDAYASGREPGWPGWCAWGLFDCYTVRQSTTTWSSRP